MGQEKKKYTGVLDGYFATGTEGTLWTVDTRNRNYGLYGEVFIEPGDYLTVYGNDGSVIFQGEIQPDYKTGRRNYPGSKKYGQQCALGFWIHWIQKGWQPDDWAKLFIAHWFKKKKRLRAELIKK